MTLLLYFNGIFIEVSGSLTHMHEDFWVYFHAYSLKTYFYIFLTVIRMFY